jgi:hypothetical protein
VWGSIIIHAEGVQISHSTEAVHSGEPMKTSPRGLAQGKTAVFVIPRWIILREQTLVISRECRRYGAQLIPRSYGRPLSRLEVVTQQKWKKHGPARKAERST